MNDIMLKWACSHRPPCDAAKLGELSKTSWIVLGTILTDDFNFAHSTEKYRNKKHTRQAWKQARKY